MAYQSNETILDEIDRLFVVYEKAKEYLTKISSVVDDQIEIWQHRRKVIQDQSKSTSSFDFLLPKTQRINELSIDAVQALCRVDLLTEQIFRIDPKSLNQTSSVPFTARLTESARQQTVSSSSTPSFKQSPINSESISNGKFPAQSLYFAPVLRTQTTSSLSNRPTASSNQEHATFKPIEQQQQQSPLLANPTPRPTPLHPQLPTYSSTEKTNFPRSLMPNNRNIQTSEYNPPSMRPVSTNLMTSMAYRSLQEKTKVKLQRIVPGTKWKQAKIEVIDSLSAFYVENRDPKIHDLFTDMFNELHDHYDAIEQSGQLKPLENIAIGDFGVAKFSDDNRWYRARLLTAEEDNHIKIVYIDFGNIETKYIDEFFPLDRCFTDLPAQAVACSLSNAFPRSSGATDEKSLWPEETVQIFRNEVLDKVVEIYFEQTEEGTEKWPLNFVKITANNQTVASSLNLKQRIEPKPNRFIAEQLASSLNTQELILFNIPVTDDEVYE